MPDRLNILDQRYVQRTDQYFFSRCFTRLRVKILQLCTCSLPSPCPQPYSNSNSSSIFSFSPRRESSMRALYIIKRRTRTARSFTVYVPITSCLSCVIKKIQKCCITIYPSHTQTPHSCRPEALLSEFTSLLTPQGEIVRKATALESSSSLLDTIYYVKCGCQTVPKSFERKKKEGRKKQR